MDLALLCFQAKDSDDEEEVVHVDRDHFMDEFFEQVELPVWPGRDPCPSPKLPLPCGFPHPCTLLGLLGLADFTEHWLGLIWPSNLDEVSLISCPRWKRSEAASRNCLKMWSR